MQHKTNERGASGTKKFNLVLRYKEMDNKKERMVNRFILYPV